MVQQATITLAFACAVLGATAQTAVAQLRAEAIASGLRNPVAVVADPTDRAILFVLEQNGLIRIVRDGALLDQPFLDLRNQVSSGGERGLLGLALAPDFAESRRFFVNFTNRSGDTVIARFRRAADNPLAADPGSRFDLVWPDGRPFIGQPFSNHNGGHLAFGPDGRLYIGTGDGGSGGDPMNNAQNPRSLLGKMLRIDVTVPDDDPRGYRIPEDNPFLGGEPISALGEIWSIGLRNPWGFSFDDPERGGVGALVIGDVGQNAREEIDFEPRGAGGRNYGWRLREGRASYDSRTAPAFLPITDPIHDYGRDVGQSITGGVIYRGSQLDPMFHGRYFYADFAAGRLFSLGLALDEAGEATAIDEREHTGEAGGNRVLGLISGFGVDQDGEMLITNYSGGTILRVVPDLSLLPPAPEIYWVDKPRTLAVSADSGGRGVRLRAFLLETLGANGRFTVTRLEMGERMSFSPVAASCFRVRAVNEAGAGPPSHTICPSH